MQEIQFYKSNETLSNRYYQIPQELFVSSLYKDKLNSDSKITLKKFIKWICKKFSYPSEDEIVRDFQRETTNFNIENTFDINEFKKQEKSFVREL